MHRLPLACATAVGLLASALLAQPTAPTGPVHPPDATSGEPRRAASAVALSVNTDSREQVRQFYRAIYSASENVPMEWTGSYATGNAGDTSAAYQEATRLRINFYRALVGVPAAVTLNSTFSAKAQQAALMMSGNNALQHTGIPTSWTYYTTGGAEAAANSNLALGSAGPDAITGYMVDAGSNNAAVGHRRWLQYPQTQEMGTGDVPGSGTMFSANATWVFDSRFGTTRPATRTTQVAYPPAGYVPYPLVFPRWSFSYPGADFSAASVTMARGGQSVPVAPEPLAGSIGENTLVWVYNGLDANDDTAHPKPSADTAYTVTVSNVRINGASQNFTYTVTVFDPDVAGPDAMSTTVTGPAAPAVGAANTYAVALPTFAGAFDWRTLQLASFNKVYGAEPGLDGATASTSAGYSFVQGSVVGAGSSAFRFAHPSPGGDQLLTLPETFLVTSDAGAVTFLSRLGWASATQIAHVQVSLDDGISWSDIYTQAGTGGSGEGSFTARSASLAAYRNRTIRVRFLYSMSGSFFPQTSAGVGWYLDNVTLTGVQAATGDTASRVSGGSAFGLTPSAAGSISLQARGVLFNTYPLEWGPVTQVDAAVVTSTGAYLSNLSVRTSAGTGAQVLTVGFAVSGGSKQLLIRGIGPTLEVFGLTGVLADPQLRLFSNSSGALLNQNDNWPVSASTTFQAVQAFDLPASSKDAALVGTLTPDTYSAQVSGTDGGTGLALVELYDVSGPSSGARLVNVSARTQVGTGADVLIVGFVVGGTGQRQVLIRAVGPTLGTFGVPGVLQDPKLELFSSSTKLNENDDWGGSGAISSAGTAVFAFPLGTGSKDAALLVSLAPGLYTAQVSGVGNTTGIALVEVYEVP